MGKKGFTLVELLVATAIMLIVIVVLLQVIAGMTSVWHKSAGTISNFQAARSAFTTINRVMARATLNTYTDYVDAQGNSRAGNEAAFVPASFERASELHFVSGPTTVLLPGATAATNPGHAAFFQAPLGVTSSINLATDKYLQRAMNSVGFYIQYGDLDTSIFPNWLTSLFVATDHHYRFRLIQYVQPTENLSVYSYTSTGSWNLSWLPLNTVPKISAADMQDGNAVLAEDVLLLILRPRLEPQDEISAATTLGTSYTSTDPTLTGSVISPNYSYDSRAWQTGYSYSTATVKSKTYAGLMRNQLPPIVNVVMVCADPTSLAHLQLSNSATPPPALLPTGLFTKSDDTDFEADLATFGAQLTALHVNYRIFRSSAQIQAAAWSNQKAL